MPDGELTFHAGSTFLERPPMGATLHGREIPSTGGGTPFANSPTGPCRTMFGPGPPRALHRYFTQVRTGAFDRKTAPTRLAPPSARIQKPAAGRCASTA